MLKLHEVLLTALALTEHGISYLDLGKCLSLSSDLIATAALL